MVHLQWDTPQTISETILYFDGDFDHSMESVLWGHPERAVTFCVKKYEILDDHDRVLATVDDQHLSVARHSWPQPIKTSRLSIRILETWGAPAALLEVRCYG